MGMEKPVEKLSGSCPPGEAIDREAELRKFCQELSLLGVGVNAQSVFVHSTSGCWK